MSIRDYWLDVLETIARTNGAGCREDVFRERDERTHGLTSELSRSLIAAHSSSELQALEDYIVYLIWHKLTQSFGGAGQDSFLGVTDLREYLVTRDPRHKPQYAPEHVDAFLAPLQERTHLGDLRAWLCARTGVRSQLYSQKEFDMHLRQADIEQLLRQPPALVVDQMSDGPSSRAQALRRFRKKSYRQLVDLLPRGIPLQIRGWAFVIARQLITGACDCPEVYSLVTSDLPRAAKQAETRCRHYHFLCETNHQQSLRKELPQQKRPTADVLEYVERAVVERLRMPLSKTFANTMLCNVFVTPGGYPLRMKKWRDKTVLTEAGRELVVDEETLDQGQTATQRAPCLGCLKCLCLVGSTTSVKQCSGHPLGYATIDRSENDRGQYHSICVSVCQSRHAWLGEARCPVCDQAAVHSKRKIDIYVPTGQSFESIEWQLMLPRSHSK